MQTELAMKESMPREIRRRDSVTAWVRLWLEWARLERVFRSKQEKCLVLGWALAPEQGCALPL